MLLYLNVGESVQIEIKLQTNIPHINLIFIFFRPPVDLTSDQKNILLDHYINVSRTPHWEDYNKICEDTGLDEKTCTVRFI